MEKLLIVLGILSIVWEKLEVLVIKYWFRCMEALINVLI